MLRSKSRTKIDYSNAKTYKLIVFYFLNKSQYNIKENYEQ